MNALKQNAVYGAIIGDMVGSVHEFMSYKLKDKVYTFPLWEGRAWQPFLQHESQRTGSRYTDDTVTGLAIANALMSIKEHGVDNQDDMIRLFADSMKVLCSKYEWAGYGGRFWNWLRADWNNPQSKPYQSWGNGSAMRVFPVAIMCDSIEDVRRMAVLTALPTHDHPEGIKGAEATASAAFLARTGLPKEEIRQYIESEFDYDLSTPLDEIRPNYEFKVSCQESVPQSIRCFLEGNSFEECIRLAVSLGGDADTMGCICGGIAAHMYPIPKSMVWQAKMRLPKELRDIAEKVNQKYK